VTGAGTNDYLNLLEQWLKGAEPYLYECPDRPELMCYGTGENGWGVQTNQKAFAAYAMLATDSRFDERRAGRSREVVMETALRLLRFCLHTHKEGTYRCTDGTSWGHTWISVLGTERMMHAVEALEAHLTEEDRALLRRVMLSESDWLLDHYPIAAGLYNKDGNNKPESNLWNGAFLHRTAAAYPDAPRAGDYREKGSAFLVNAISVPGDAESGEIVDGRKVSERYVDANFFPSFGLNHHGYLNVGYMVICLSNMAMLHFAFRRKGIVPPESLYRHGRELWEVVKQCTFPDGRLLRIGGDTRVRYTYCQDYVIPVWHMIADLYGDADCLRFEEGWLRQIRTEMEASGDGTFLSYRCKALRDVSPLYFTRLESDRAAALSMGLAWRELAYSNENGSREHESTAVRAAQRTSAEIGLPPEEAWHDEYHGAYLQRGKKRIASWVWDSAEKPQGLCLPPSASDMAEWKENLAGQLQGLGQQTGQTLEKHAGHMFPGGFLTWGSTIVHTRGLLAEGQQDEQIARNRFVCAALPDDTHMIVLHYAVALRQRTFLRAVKGMNLLIPNDVFNGNHRTYYGENGRLLIDGCGSVEETVRTGSRWLNIDDRLGAIAAYGAGEMAICRPGRRQIGMSDNAKTLGLERTLYADQLCGPCTTNMQTFAGGDVIVDTGYVLQSGEGREHTALYAGSDRLLSALEPASVHCRGLYVQGADGKAYIVAANFGETGEVWPIPYPGEWSDMATGESFRSGPSGDLPLVLAPGGARLLVR
jgi:hypothetical protein